MVPLIVPCVARQSFVPGSQVNFPVSVVPTAQSVTPMLT